MSINGIELPNLPGSASPDVEMAIGTSNGEVVVSFRLPQKDVRFKPDNAAHIGKHLIDLACELGAKVVINVPRRQLTPGLIEAMVARAAHVIRSTQDQNRAPNYVARSVVESIIKAIDEAQV